MDPAHGPCLAPGSTLARRCTAGTSLVALALVSFVATGAATAYVRLDNIETRDISALIRKIPEPVVTETPDPTDPNDGRALNRMDLVSIPRETRVDIPSCMYYGTTSRAQSARFNAASSIGAKNEDVGEAAACTINTVQSLIGIPIDGWVVVDFAGFRNMVDALGGVEMCIPDDKHSDKAALDITAGVHRVDMFTALAFARARTGEGLGNGSDITASAASSSSSGRSRRRSSPRTCSPTPLSSTGSSPRRPSPSPPTRRPEALATSPAWRGACGASTGQHHLDEHAAHGEPGRPQ